MSWESLLGSCLGFTCPACQRTLMVDTVSLNISSKRENQKFGIQCPFCQHVFAFALVAEPYKGPIPEETSDGPVQLGKPAVTGVATRASDTAAFNPATRRNQSSIQRSNVLNPNNPAHRAATNNRSNQMNPNNPARRSSRGQGRR